MYDISVKMAEIMMSNIRPKCTPTIKAYKTNSNGSQTVIEWKAKDIKDFTFKHEIDPVGRTLPYIELTWTEVYRDREDFEETKKYLSASKYMAVELSISQNLGFYNSWKSLYEIGATWKDLFDRKTTWKQLKNQVNTETITFPILFLEDKPIIEDMTIKWTARDFLSYLNKEITKTFDAGLQGIWYFTPIYEVLNDCKEEFKDNTEVLNWIFSSMNNIPGVDPNEKLNKSIYVSSTVKDFLKNYFNLKNYYLGFSENGLSFNRFWGLYQQQESNKTYFGNKTLFNQPKKTKNVSVSEYYYKGHEFNDNGEWVEYGYYVVSRFIKGEGYYEYNPLCPYLNFAMEMEDRAAVIGRYFGSDESPITFEFESLPHFEFQSGDVVQIEDNEQMHYAVIVSSELTYNGGYKQKTIAHEIL